MQTDASEPAPDGCFIRGDGSNLVDLSHPWHVGMTELPFFPPLEVTPLHTFERDGIRSAQIRLVESCGTHCEAPSHVLETAPTLEQLPVPWLIGPLVVVDVRAQCSRDPDYKLTIADLEAWESRNGRIPARSWLVMQSGWSSRWNTPGFLNLDPDGVDHYPGFDPAAAAWLVREDRHIVGIGTECFSPEGGTAARRRRGGTQDEPVATGSSAHDGRRPLLPVRQELLPKWNTLVVSNLANVDRLPECGAWLIVGALAFRGGSGSPSRVFGVLPAGE